MRLRARAGARPSDHFALPRCVSLGAQHTKGWQRVCGLAACARIIPTRARQHRLFRRTCEVAVDEQGGLNADEDEIDLEDEADDGDDCPPLFRSGSPLVFVPSSCLRRVASSRFPVL